MTIARAAVSAPPYIEGEIRRFTSAPTKLTPLAGKMMLASEALSTRRKVPSFRIVPIAGPMALVAMAAAYFFASGLTDIQTQRAGPVRSEAQLVPVCVADWAAATAATCQQATRAELLDLATAAVVVAHQDRFEIDRFIRLSSTVRHVEVQQHQSSSRSIGVSAR